MVVVPYEEKLLLCEYHHTSIGHARIIIAVKDKLIMDYIFAVDIRLAAFQRSLEHCKTFAPPARPSSMLNNLTTHSLPEDIIDLVGSFNRDLHCGYCSVYSFNMSVFKKFTAAVNQGTMEHARVSLDVEEEASSCAPKEIRAFAWDSHPTLQACMASPKANQVAFCEIPSLSWWTKKIRNCVRWIEADEEEIEERQHLMQKDFQTHQKFVEDSQALIKEGQESIKHLQDRAMEPSSHSMKLLTKEDSERIGYIEEQVQEGIQKSIQRHRRMFKDAQEFIKERQAKIMRLHEDIDMYEQNIGYVRQMTTDAM